MNIEARRADRNRTLPDYLAVKINLHEGGRSNFLVEKPEWIDQEVVFRPRDAGGNVCEYQIVPAL